VFSITAYLTGALFYFEESADIVLPPLSTCGQTVIRPETRTLAPITPKTLEE
jgi:hypothetical protein